MHIGKTSLHKIHVGRIERRFGGRDLFRILGADAISLLRQVDICRALHFGLQGGCDSLLKVKYPLGLMLGVGPNLLSQTPNPDT